MRNPSPELSSAIVRLLRLDGVSGHTQIDSLAVARQANDDKIETAARNLSLREIYLARGLFWSGDIDDLGRHILESYTSDLRGLFARHAKAVLSSKPSSWREEAPLEWAV